MKNISYLIILFATLGLFACSEDIMQEINNNPNNPADVASKFIITDVINSTSFSVASGDFAFYASVYIEYNVGIYNQMYNAEVRLGEPSNATTYNNTWNSVYTNLLQLKTIIAKCSEGGDEEGNTTVLGMAQILSAYNLAILTDVMGDVPWTEALQPSVIWTPQLDKQEDIYRAVNKFIDDGIAHLEAETDFEEIEAQDPIFEGKADSWIKFAYGLKARYAMRMSKIAPNYDVVINAANNSFTNKSDEAIFTCSTSTIRNPFYLFFTDRNYFGASESLHNKLVSRNDPRDTIFFKPHPKADALHFAPNGKPEQRQDYYGISALAVASAPIYLMSFHELEFLKAEA